MSKTLKYQQEYFDLTTEEADRISNMLLQKNKATHFYFRGQTLKTSFVELKEKKNEIVGEKRIHEMTTEELKEIIGDFERQYEEHKTGAIIHNDILGDEHEGIIEWALATDVITRKKSGELSYCFIVEPEGIEWTRKRDAMRELRGRRKYAEKLNK